MEGVRWGGEEKVGGEEKGQGEEKGRGDEGVGKQRGGGGVPAACPSHLCVCVCARARACVRACVCTCHMPGLSAVNRIATHLPVPFPITSLPDHIPFPAAPLRRAQPQPSAA